MGDTLRDAAFAWLITGNTTYRDAGSRTLRSGVDQWDQLCQYGEVVSDIPR